MSWGAQNRSEDAKTPSAGPAMSENPEPGLWPVQPYLHSHTRTMRATHGLTDTPSLLPTGIVCGALAPRSRQDTATPASRDSNHGSVNHDMSRLSALAYPNDARHPWPHRHTSSLLPTDIGCGTLAPRSRQDTATPAARDSNLDSANHDMSRLSALAYPNDARHPWPHRHTSSLLPTDIGCDTLAPRSRRPGTATHATRDSDLGNVSEFSCPNDAPIHGLADIPLRLLLTDIGCGALAPRSQTRRTHNTTTSAILTPSRRKNYVPASPWLLSPDGAHLHAHRSLRCTTSNGYWVCHPAPRSKTTHGNTHCLRLKPRQ
jgi:hypothetical protein